ncbi:MAG: pyruvate dehydrogenase (acetyl-transferring) E1 component subunit alpha [Bacteroidetes bacterium MED-G17]|mgnify:FL=1|nr:MAG: pyruvate dehydrogenase (acetyl-transferring) E1 component subunit alpha [Bacteroidetes bacterium MED-G17]|tara:strand:- start:2543 stop:3532 length:990 start_codon:yes stop_codon:yes gene_type:complete
MSKVSHSKSTYLEWYRLMVLIRKFELKSAQMYGQQKIRGFLHLYSGQEAVIAGTMSAIEKQDKLITAYRDHGHALAVGVSANECMAELYGKATGCTKGKGGSMHFFAADKNYFGGHGIVGGQIPLGAGIALADKYQENNAVTFCYMGDGAVRQGALHETFNMAMLWKLPVVFVVENNQYAMGTSVERTTNVLDLYKIGSAYEMPSEPIDGMDCEAVHESIEKAAKRAREGDGPTFLEMKTYRYRGHSMSDPGHYRTKEELKSFREDDPIGKVKVTILKKKYATEKELTALENEQDKLVEESVEFAENSPYPSADELHKDVYVGDYPFLK